MSAISEYQEQRIRRQVSRLKQVNWNVDIIYWAAYEFGFRLVKHTETHYSLHQSKKKRMDYWPDKNKGLWYYKNHSEGNPIPIPDIEAYLMKHFKPKQ